MYMWNICGYDIFVIGFLKNNLYLYPYQHRFINLSSKQLPNASYTIC